MTDTALRRLEAEWLRSPADDALAEQLVTACRRARRDPPWSALRRCERWRRVDGFVTKWFSRPLEETDGVPPAELDGMAEVRGWQEPRALREWFQLAGRRSDLTAEEGWKGVLWRLPASNGEVVLYRADGEGGCSHWSIPVAEPVSEDPRVEWWRGAILGTSRGAPFEETRWLTPQPLSEFLLAVVLRTLLVEARPWSRRQDTRCPLGAIHGRVTPSHPGLASYHRLPITFPDREKAHAFFGDADTLIFIGLGDDGYLKGAARTRPALDRLQAAFPDLAPALWP